MTMEWFSVARLVELRLPGMPANETGIRRLIKEQYWNERPDQTRLVEVEGAAKPVREYHISLLPGLARGKIARSEAVDAEREATRAARKRLHWAAWDLMTDEQRNNCHARYNCIMAVEEAFEVNRAIDRAETAEEVLARVLGKFEVSVSTYYEWRKVIRDVDQEDWLAALAPKYVPDGEIRDSRAECHPDAWAALKSDYLRAEGPGFSACYRRMKVAAKERGWAPIPSERALRRRLDAEVERVAQIYARQGKKKAESVYPPQIRTKDHLHAMQIVNTDGHKLDLFVSVPWKATPTRITLLGIQDIYSAKILAWRLSEAETWDVVRACIGDMIEDHGIPEKFFMDNGRAFAAQAISGDQERRLRFRKKKKKVNRFGIVEEEVGGILKNFGIEARFTRPYAGQSKPIERAWKDLAEEICKHPAMAGAYTGNKPDAKPENYMTRAIPLDVLQAHVADRIAEHNARVGRKSKIAKGRSFDQVFEESMQHPSTIVRRATEAQREYWLLAEKVVTARKDRGAIHHLDNVYWSSEMVRWESRKVKIRFDPDRLHDPIKVYAPNGQLICTAPCTEKGRFEDTAAAHIHNRSRKAFLKHTKALVDLHRTLSPDEVADIYADKEKAGPKKPIHPAVTRIVSGNLAVKQEEAADAISAEEYEARLQRALTFASEDVIPFPGPRPGQTRTEK